MYANDKLAQSHSTKLIQKDFHPEAAQLVAQPILFCYYTSLTELCESSKTISFKTQCQLIMGQQSFLLIAPGWSCYESVERNSSQTLCVHEYGE